MPGAASPISPHQTVPVSTQLGRYDVLIGRGLLSSLGSLARPVSSAARTLLVHDSALPSRLVSVASQSLNAAGFETRPVALTADERTKTFDSVEAIISAAIQSRLERTEPVIALGGGIIGDVAGFAAACYRRGVPVIQCPTTLLSMVDASVGGKTGVNVEVGTSLKKNMAGAFHQPALVVCDVEALDSLPDREFRSGLAECIKHALIGADFGNPGLLGLMRANLPGILARDQVILPAFIAQNVAIKAACIGNDVFETAASSLPHGGRMALNCGHTVAHAIETLPSLTHENSGLKGLTHGEAVGLGLLAECRLAISLGLNSPAAAEELAALLNAAHLPTRLRGLPPAGQLMSGMLDDKKVAEGKLRMALPCAEGHCRLVTDPPRDAVLAALETIHAD